MFAGQKVSVENISQSFSTLAFEIQSLSEPGAH